LDAGQSCLREFIFGLEQHVGGGPVPRRRSRDGHSLAPARYRERTGGRDEHERKYRQNEPTDWTEPVCSRTSLRIQTALSAQLPVHGWHPTSRRTWSAI
jgi:hypothetical protein